MECIRAQRYGIFCKAGSANSATDQTAAYNLPPACNAGPTATASFTSSDTVVCQGEAA